MGIRSISIGRIPRSYKMHAAIWASTKLRERTTRRTEWWNTLFFDRFGEKVIGPVVHGPSDSRSAESGAARGSCAKFQEVEA